MNELGEDYTHQEGDELDEHTDQRLSTRDEKWQLTIKTDWGEEEIEKG